MHQLNEELWTGKNDPEYRDAWNAVLYIRKRAGILKAETSINRHSGLQNGHSGIPYSFKIIKIFWYIVLPSCQENKYLKVQPTPCEIFEGPPHSVWDIWRSTLLRVKYLKVHPTPCEIFEGPPYSVWNIWRSTLLRVKYLKVHPTSCEIKL